MKDCVGIKQPLCVFFISPEGNGEKNGRKEKKVVFVCLSTIWTFFYSLSFFYPQTENFHLRAVKIKKCPLTTHRVTTIYLPIHYYPVFSSVLKLTLSILPRIPNLSTFVSFYFALFSFQYEYTK